MHMTIPDRVKPAPVSSFHPDAALERHSLPPNHNWLIHTSETIRESYARAQGATAENLETFVSIGELLNEVKETFAGAKRGSFGDWCEEQGFAFGKTWRARLMKLAANWPAVKASVEELPATERDWTVNGALKIWGTAVRKAKSTPECTSEEGDGTAEPKKKKETEAEKLRKDLAAALERIAFLEGQLVEFQKKPPVDSKVLPKIAEQSPAMRKRAQDNMAIVYKDRFKRQWPVYKGASTEGERKIAEERLEDIAKRMGKSFVEVAQECGLS